MNRACFPKDKHQNSQKWAKFMNFSFWPFLWFGLPGRPPPFGPLSSVAENECRKVRAPAGFSEVRPSCGLSTSMVAKLTSTSWLGQEDAPLRRGSGQAQLHLTLMTSSTGSYSGGTPKHPPCVGGPPCIWAKWGRFVFFSLPFWKMARKTTKKTGISYACRTPRILEKEWKNAQNRKEFLEKEKGKEIQKGKEKKIRE